MNKFSVNISYKFSYKRYINFIKNEKELLERQRNDLREKETEDLDDEEI